MGEWELGRATEMVGSGFSRNAEARSSSVGPFPLWSEVAVAMRDALYPKATTPEDERRPRAQRYGSVNGAAK